MNEVSAAFVDRLRRFKTQFERWIDTSTDRAPNAAPQGAAEPSTGSDARTVTDRLGDDVDPDDIETRSDVMLVLGMTPAEFVESLVAEHGGRLRQQAFTDYTAWSRSTVSRLLQELEDEGDVVRVQVGREKIVCLPGHAPARFPSDLLDGNDARVA